MSFFSINAFWRGVEIVRTAVASAATALTGGIAVRRLEQTMLAQHQGRFQPVGIHPNAQTAPDGRPWKRPHPSTIRRRRNKDRGQALVDRGNLKKSVIILESRMSGAVLQTSAGGVIRIGVNPASKASVYAEIQQIGGRTPRGGVIPPRPFIGFSESDVATLTSQIDGDIRKPFRR